MSTPDPFDQIATQLRRAHHLRPDDAEPASAAPTPTVRRRWRGRLPTIAILVGVAIGGTATAAVIVATREPSRPLAGRLVPGTGPSDQRYLVRLGPSLDAGDTAWCASTQVRRGPDITSGSACGAATTNSSPVISSGGLMDTSPDGTSVIFAVVDRRVSAMRLPSGRRITPIRAPELPNEFRAIIATPQPQDAESQPAFEGLDGRPVPRPTRASSLPRQATRNAKAGAVGTGPCAIEASGAVRLQSQRILRSQPAAAPRANGRPFLTCASAVVRMKGRRFVAAVLLDAKHPGDLPAPLPGSVPDGAGSYRAFPAISAVRTKDAWLLVRGVDDAVRRDVLRALSVRRQSRP